MHDGYTPSSANISIPREEYTTLTKIRDKHKCLLVAIKNLQRFKVGYSYRDSEVRDSEVRESEPTMLPDTKGGYVNHRELSDLILTDEEISKRNKIRDIDEEIKRLNVEREKLSNGK